MAEDRSPFGKVVGLIPARLNSSRLPGKALADICGLPMVIHVARRALLAKHLDSVVVCTDDEQIAKTCLNSDLNVCLTPSSCINGTERISSAAEILGFHDETIVIDIQGDEPLVNPSIIDQIVLYILKHPHIADIFLPHVVGCPANTTSIVKVVEAAGRVLYLSRNDVPVGFNAEIRLKKHLSVIGFTKKSLFEFCQQPVGKLERTEGIELLRALEAGQRIHTFPLDTDSFSVDTKDDLTRARECMESDELFTSGYRYND